MNSEAFFYPSIIITFGLSFVALIILGVTAMHDAKQGGNKAAIVRRGYIYLVSFITLLLVSVSLVNLLDLGLRATVLPKADPMIGYYSSPPPTLFFASSATTKDTDPFTALTCASGCTLTEAQKTDIANWEQSYGSWLQTNGGTTSKRAQSLVTPLSFLIIAGLAFLFHWRWVKKDTAELDESVNLTRTTYFTAMSFVWLLTLIVSGGFLLNTTLRAVIPGAEEPANTSKNFTLITSDVQTVDSMTTCGTKCGLSDATVSKAKQWKNDYTAWQDRQNNDQIGRDRENALATEASFFVIALPLFLLHFRTAWRKKKQQPPTQTV